MLQIHAKTQKTEICSSTVIVKTKFYCFEVHGYYDNPLETVKAYFDKVLEKGTAFFFIAENEFKTNHHYKVEGATITENWYEEDQQHIRLTYFCGIPVNQSTEEEMGENPNNFLQVPIPNVHPYFKIERGPAVFSLDDPFEVNRRSLSYSMGKTQFQSSSFYKEIANA